MFLNNVLTVVLMAAAASVPSPIACNLKALNPAERARHAALSEKLRAAAVARQELPDGLSFRLNPSAMNLVELAGWVDAERRCCPFLDFQIALERESGGLQLSLTGRQGVKEFLLSDFAKVAPVTK
jgi:hypothetical protein